MHVHACTRSLMATCFSLPGGAGGLVRFLSRLQCEALCVFLVNIPGAGGAGDGEHVHV